ncbi:YhgE/Pip domain-containing protein [Kutzneria sp. CA-103260]|uniref:YhgE/Pip domain-containing protein n=1 Tax=Kutzneria sp. CA-103260 TaxID=2802641 RepID=UPI001BA96D08|nr:YhgE/Pip domain-containing protein [Kutzneria sp. CA-103260]QUQ67955.1 YhgE/Pip domain-containing protein [Kutzneria sp. CA-103260]
MFKPFANSARALATGPLTWKTWTGLIAVPVLIMGLLSWALWSPDTDHGTATAAVVNNDQPVKVNGQLIPLGRQLTGDLTHSSGSAYKWVLTDASDASSGLDDGTYAAVVTIPSDFSARATSAASGKPLDASRAVVDIKTSASSGVVDPALSQRIADGTQQTLNNQIVETYLDNIYVGFSTIHGQINQAADGAGQLADGTRQLVPGAQQVADGAAKLASGTAQLATGSAQLSSGLTEAQQQTAQLPALTKKLADGAEQVAQGNEKLAGTIVPLANQIIAAIDALPSASASTADVQKLADQCSGDVQFCDNLRQVAARLTADAGKIDGAKAAMRAQAVQVRDGIQVLASGARQVANGNAQLAKQSGTLAAGIATAADGARQLNTGVQQANSGAQQLAGGSQQLSDGTGKVNDGAQQLSSSLDKGRDQVPNYTDAERSHLKTIAADPTTLASDSTSSGALAITLFAVIALWALALATYLVTRAVPDAVLTAREPTWQIIARAALPGATAAALAAVAITAIAIPALGLGVGGSFEFLGVALLAAFAFVSLNQAVTAIFGRAGRLASLAVLVLGAATGIVSTLPSPFYALADFLPTHGAVLGLRAAVTGDAGLYTGITELFGWLIVGVLAAILVTDRRRYLSTRQLRLA